MCQLWSSSGINVAARRSGRGLLGGWRGRGGRGICRLDFGRQLHHEGRPAIRIIFAFDLAAVALHDAVTGAEAEPCPFAYGFRRIERIEDLLRLLNARPPI